MGGSLQEKNKLHLRKVPSNHKRLLTSGNKLRVAGGWGNCVMGMKEGT